MVKIKVGYEVLFFKNINSSHTHSFWEKTLNGNVNDNIEY